MSEETCHACGFVEQERKYEKKEILWKRGAKKGQVKETKEVLVEGTGVYFYRLELLAKKLWGDRWDNNVIKELLVCPDCGTIKVRDYEL